MNDIGTPNAETRKRFAELYAAMGTEGQTLALARLALRLSWMARETYTVGRGVADSERLRTFNEAQHRILGQLERLLTSDPRRYPDDVFANILCDQCEMLGVDPQALLGAIGIGQPEASGASPPGPYH